MNDREDIKPASILLTLATFGLLAYAVMNQPSAIKDVSIERPATAQVVTLPKTEPDSMLNESPGSYAANHK